MESTASVHLTERAKEILHWAIATFIATGKPVGSRGIARHSREHLSAATVRNIMADLEEMGYLRQPHASAGRIPTDKGYRFYVDNMLERRAILPQDQAVVDRVLQPDDSVEHLMARTSQVLSRISNNVGIVVSPSITRIPLQHIQFVKLVDKRILVVIVSRSSLVQNRIIRLEEEFTQVELDQAAKYIVEHFKNKTLLEIRGLILQLIKQDRAQYDQFLQRVILLSAQTFPEAQVKSETEIYVDGASNLMKTPEFSDLKRMRILFETIEERSRLASLISECIKEDTQEVRISIGTENALADFGECSLITSLYVVDDKTRGSLGILGPTRMEYGRAISLVEYVARIFGKVLGSGN